MSDNQDDKRVTYRVNDGIAYVTMNRPDKRNALDMPMFKQLDALYRTIKKDKHIRVVIVSGAGEDFCSGLDVKSVLASPGNAVKLLRKWWPGNANLAQRVSTNWRKLPVPVIMAIHGRCWGGGLQIALGADFRIAQPNASLSIMENKWGLIPDMGGTLALRELMPVDVAMNLAMTAKEVSASDALKMNLLTEIADDPIAASETLAKELINRSPDTIAAIKKLYHNAWHKNDGALLAKESWYQIRILAGKNQRIATMRETKDPSASFKQRSF